MDVYYTCVNSDYEICKQVSYTTMTKSWLEKMNRACIIHYLKITILSFFAYIAHMFTYFITKLYIRVNIYIHMIMWNSFWFF